ncbi:MAG: PAS domain-containing sensor histidine kinase [Caldimonas sp.]
MTSPFLNEASSELLLRWAEQTEDFALFFLSPDARIIAVNAAATRLFGYESAELQGQSLRLIFTPEDLERGLADHEIEVAMELGRTEDDRWHLCKDGSRIWVNGVLLAVKDATNVPLGLMKIMRDRTDVRTQTETLGNRLEGALRLACRKDAFLSTFSHEVRNPLNAIVNSLVLLRSVPTGPKADKALTIAERQLTNLRRLMDDLLDVTRIDLGALQLKLERVNLQTAIEGAVSLLAPAASTRQHEVRVIVPEVAIELEADPVRLDQILRNLLENAIKYTPPRGHISVTATVEGKMAAVRIVDDGDGMTAETLPRIFEMFTRDAKVMDSATEGLGIGLAVVKNLVRLHHGTVEVQSAGAGKGSEFTVHLPLEQPRLA